MLDLSTLDPRAQRDHLLTVVYAHDPQPPRCDQPGHGSAADHRRTCPACGTWHRWRTRMYKRFWQLGLRFSLDDRAYDDPRPPDCPHGHARTAANTAICDHCRTIKAWYEREYRRQENAGVPRRCTDFSALLDHLHELLDAGMIVADIAAANVGKTSVSSMLAAECPRRRPVPHRRRRVRAAAERSRRGLCPRCDQMIPLVRADTLARHLTGRKYVRPDLDERIRAVPLPERRRRMIRGSKGWRLRLVDATGTKRRIRAACRNGHSIPQQAARLGWSPGVVQKWLRSAGVDPDAVATLFPSLIAHPGTNARAANAAARAGWPEARYFSETNIDDPAYEPFALVDDPVAVYRMLRALAWMGHGPRQVAEPIGETPEQVAVWLEGGPAPAYARHMVEAAFDALGGDFGPDEEIAARARRLGWAPPLAWHGIDIDNPACRARRDLPPGARLDDYPLDSQVLFAVFGLVTEADLLKAEKIRVVRILHRLGWSDRRIAVWLRWNSRDEELATKAVYRFRTREADTDELQPAA